MSDPYLFPESDVLRNRLGIKDAETLDRLEKLVSTNQARKGVPKGRFDLVHLRAIHRHLFGAVYDWAGEVRTVEMSKGGSPFQPVKYIDTGMADVYKRLVADRLLKNKSPKQFAEKAAQIIGDINHVHPFREGNGRTQMLYLSQLAEQAGYALDFGRIDAGLWMDASREANAGRYEAMASCIEAGLSRSLSLGRGR